jgi:hypothetical protein
MRADQQGNVFVADCVSPSEKVELTVMRGRMVYRFRPEEITVIKAGEGTFVIDALLPSEGITR